MIRYGCSRSPGTALRGRLRDLANERRRFGHRRLFVLLWQEGEPSGINWIYRFYRDEGLTVRKRRARRKAVETRAPILVEAKPNACWSLDFIHEQFANGRRFRILNIVDDVTKGVSGSHCGYVDFSTTRRPRTNGDRRTTRKPAMIVPDHGTEFTCNAILTWADQRRVAWHLPRARPCRMPFESFMYRRPADARDFSSTLDTGRVRSCIRPVSATDAMAAGPDGDRGSRPHQRVALVALKALRACSIPSSAGVHHAVIRPHTIRWPTYAGKIRPRA